jgi:hypothetical protein
VATGNLLSTRLLLLAVQINIYKHLALHLTLAVAAVEVQEPIQVIVLDK